MNRRTLAVLALVALSACAGQTYRAAAGPMFVRARGEVALQNSSGTLSLGENQNTLQGDLGLGNTETVPYVRLQTDIDKHRIRLHGFGMDADGSGTLTKNFGEITAGSTVSTSMEFYAIAATYGYHLWRTRDYSIAVGSQLGYYSLDVAARSALARESVETSVFVPMPYVEAEVYFGDFTIGGNAGIFAADLGDASGRYWDLEAYVQWSPQKKFDLMFGYRYLLIDAYGRASSRDFDADVDIQGVYLTAGIRF